LSAATASAAVPRPRSRGIKVKFRIKRRDVALQNTPLGKLINWAAQ
jgi:hypothetical protein